MSTLVVQQQSQRKQGHRKMILNQSPPAIVEISFDLEIIFIKNC